MTDRETTPPAALSAEQMIVKMEGIESVLAPLAAGFTPGTRGALADARSVLAALRAPAMSDKLTAALSAAITFIENGVELGYIRMPDADCPDPAHNTLPMLKDALAALRAPTAPPGDLVAQLRAKIEAMPAREEWLGGQRTKYLNRDEVLGWFDNPPALGTPPVDGKPEPGSREWWREVAQGLGVKANTLQRALELMLEAYEAHDSWCGNKAGSPGNSLHWMAANAARNALGVERTKQPYRAPALGTPLAAEAATEKE